MPQNLNGPTDAEKVAGSDLNKKSRSIFLAQQHRAHRSSAAGVAVQPKPGVIFLVSINYTRWFYQCAISTRFPHFLVYS